MKLINRDLGYIPLFDCSIHGKILMTAEEWEKARKYLLGGGERWPHEPWIMPQIRADEKRMLVTRRGYMINVRVPATVALVEKFELENYKPGNYAIEII